MATKGDKVEQLVRSHITAGRHTFTERQLANEAGIRRGAARRALKRLVDEGLLERRLVGLEEPMFKDETTTINIEYRVAQEWR